MVWPTLFGGSAGGRRVGVADALDGRAGPERRRPAVRGRRRRRRRRRAPRRQGRDPRGVLGRTGRRPRRRRAGPAPAGGKAGRPLQGRRTRGRGPAAGGGADGGRDGRGHRPDRGHDRAVRDRAPAVRPADLRLPGRGPRRGPAGHAGPGGDLVGPAGLHVDRPVRHRGGQGLDLGGVGRGRRRWPISCTARSASPRSTGCSGCRSGCGCCASPTATTGSTTGRSGGRPDGLRRTARRPQEHPAVRHGPRRPRRRAGAGAGRAAGHAPRREHLRLAGRGAAAAGPGPGDLAGGVLRPPGAELHRGGGGGHRLRRAARRGGRSGTGPTSPRWSSGG